MAFLTREILSWVTRGRALAEDRRWLLDGFASHWAHRGEPVEPVALRAAYAAGSSLTPESLRAWSSVRQSLGSCLSEAVAHRGVDVLRGLVGDDAFRDVSRDLLGRRSARGLGGWWSDRSFEGALAERNGPTVDAFLARWAEALKRDAGAHAAALESMPKAAVELGTVRDSSRTFSVRHAVTLNPLGESPERYSVLFAPLGPFGHEPEPTVFHHFEGLANQPPAALPHTFTQGQRWIVHVDVPMRALGCEVRARSERVELLR